MKLHLPHSLFRALIACFALPVALTGTSFAERVDSVIYTTHQEGPLDISEKAVVSFENIQYEGNGAAIYQDGSSSTVMTLNDNVLFTRNGDMSFHEFPSHGGAICNDGTFTLSENGAVTFSGNETYSSYTDSSCGGAIYNSGTFMLNGNGDVIFDGNGVISCYLVSYGGAIDNVGAFSLSGNGKVAFSGVNSAYGMQKAYGGAIYNSGTFDLWENGDVSFSGCGIGNDCSDNAHGGAIYNASSFDLRGNGNVNFSGNSAICYDMFVMGYEKETSLGGAIYNGGSFKLSENATVIFSENTAEIIREHGDLGPELGFDCFFVRGGAIYNSGTFMLSGNGEVRFSRNTVSDTFRNPYNYDDTCIVYTLGGAIYNSGTFTLSGNGDVLFEKNAEVNNGVCRLRSIYSATAYEFGPIPTLNLSASENHSITFRDSIYAEGVVNLNQDGSGDIIFTGATTEADLREVKRGVAGTAEEILNSRTSEIATNAMLYGGHLIVEDNAILMGHGITVTEGANATIRLNGGTLDETGYAIAVSAGSGLEFEGENTLAASAVTLAGDNFLNFILEEAQTAVNWNADLDIQGGLSLNLTHEDKPVHDSYALLAMQSGNTVTGWDAANLTINGTTAEHLVWENNTLYYRPLLVQENGDTTLDKDVDTDAAGGTIGGKDDVSINGNGHSLTVKNEVQLVQMALKDGIVKLEGENNGIVSVTLTEGGELVLTAGAGLKTGDIISMVASGKGELVISGDITLDNKGIKGKAGAQATVSHADAQVLGDATISNVRVEDSVIDLAEGSTVTFSHVALAAGSRITDDPATLALDDVTAELQLGVNTAVVSVDEVLQAGSTLVQNGNEQVSLTLAQDAVVVQLEATTFDSVTLTGDSLVLQLRGVETEFFNGADYIAISFTSGTGLATFGTDVEVLLTLDEEHFVHGYYVQGGDHTAMLFATNDKAVVTPEPATTSLSLLALAALAARRRRK